jgi:anthranilate phosphoribosyltransferase
LQRLLDVRRVVGLRNPAHSLVKLLNPCAGSCLLVTSYTHPEYLESMGAVLGLTGQAALLMRGTEGEAVADPRRTPAMDLHAHHQVQRLQEPAVGSLIKNDLPDLPEGTAALDTARYTLQVLTGERPVPTPVALQVQHIRTQIERALALTPHEATT